MTDEPEVKVADWKSYNQAAVQALVVAGALGVAAWGVNYISSGGLACGVFGFCKVEFRVQPVTCTLPELAREIWADG